MGSSAVAILISMCLAAIQIGTVTLKPKQQYGQAVVSKTTEMTYEPVFEKKQEPIFNYDLIAKNMPSVPIVNSAVVGYNDSKSWWFKRNKINTPPSAQNDICTMQYDAYYLGDVSQKVIYLTFDEGYEMGYTEHILDILKENDIKATFFVTKTYIESDPDLVKRMVVEGHTVGNHSVTHRDMSKLSDEEIVNELEGCSAYFKEVTGVDMPLFFRPPAGEYSIRTLKKTQELGYKTIFWSFAYKDWVTDEQPGKQTAYNNILKYSHNGCIMLLHAVSKSNTEALDSAIKALKVEGYRFESLENLPKQEEILSRLN
ncbi:MAG TPA: delta-lactam-biosynthetic de-N-acetylase [Lachnospiraceae bacterium]|nr:delta-lactam-biosynthetic de-N-acetylase [Lachnospiraceae bacterium]